MKTTNYHTSSFKHRVMDPDGISGTLCAHDSIEPRCIRIGGLFDDKEHCHQAGSIYDQNGLAPTLDTMQGGWRQPCVVIDDSVKPSVAKNFEREKEQTNSGWQDNKVGINISPTCRAGNDSLYALDKQYVIRKLTPKECWRLMGFIDEDFEKAAKVNSNSQLYKQAGNSVVVNVLYEIYKQLQIFYPNDFKDMSMISLFSGIGAFEKALKIL